MKPHWSKEGVVYQIYPRSFQDSNEDGIGDLKGIIQRIPYLQSLGISMVWLSPVYQSPNDDNGYDISDYYAIHPDFGSMEDMIELIQKLHQANIRIIMDLVVNHTSDEHIWFQKSVLKIPPYDQFYHWSPVKKNWGSFFGGEAWTYHEGRGEYYLHLFSKKQPDLNWANPLVREEVKQICDFWLSRGVDGFRCDVINLISKREGLPNGRLSPILCGKEHYLNEPNIHRYLQELRDDVFSKYDCFTVGETVFITPEQALSYIHKDIRELDMVFQFEHMASDQWGIKWFIRPFRMKRLKKSLSKWQRRFDQVGWNSLYLENHDQARSVNRFGSHRYREKSAKCLMTMLYFQQGTPYIYQGQEIAMTNGDFTTLAEFQDIETKNIFKFGTKSLHISPKRMMKKIFYASRDNARTPMQWDETEYAGFSRVNPWLKVNSNHRTLNVKQALEDPHSVLHYVKKMIALRKTHPVIVYGRYADVIYPNPHFYSYVREDDTTKLIIVCHFGKKPHLLPRKVSLDGYQLLLANDNIQAQERLFQPYEARVYIQNKG